VRHAPCAARFLALINGFLQRLPLVCRSSRTSEIPIRGERSALFVEGGPQDARLAALRTGGHGFFFRTGPIVLALRPSSAHVRAAVCDGAPRDGLRLLGWVRCGRRSPVLEAEQEDTSSSHFLPPSLAHSRMASCSTFRLLPPVPKATRSPSAATAPQLLWKLFSTTHLTPPSLLQAAKATLSAEALSTCSDDQPKILSFLLNAMAPQLVRSLPLHRIWHNSHAWSYVIPPLFIPTCAAAMQSNWQVWPTAVGTKSVSQTRELTESKSGILGLCFIRTSLKRTRCSDHSIPNKTSGCVFCGASKPYVSCPRPHTGPPKKDFLNQNSVVSVSSLLFRETGTLVEAGR
jgi:hypothetical protein